jgi:hypothetical protein
MMAPLRRAFDRFRGAGEAAITLPPMDGAIRPNQALETASLVLEIEQPDNLAFDGARVLFSSGIHVYAFDPARQPATPEIVAAFDSEVTCLAADANGDLAVGLNDGAIVFAAGPRRGERVAAVGPTPSCPTALLFADKALIVCHGSRRNAPLAWKRDLMERNSSGSVWRVDPASGAATCLADNLAFPYGAAFDRTGKLVVSESWRHRLTTLPTGGGAAHPLDLLPGYPARLTPASGGGYWLCVFAPRSRLVEFVLVERDFCEDMFLEVDPDHWIAPSLASGRSFLEPLQGGAIKQLGILKPWAPSRSYGLLIRLDDGFQPIASYHSRADGKRHGVTSCVDIQGSTLASCKGGNAIVRIDVAPAQGAARP